MSTRRYCDLCEAEITLDNEAGFTAKPSDILLSSRLDGKYSSRRNSNEIRFQISIALNGIWNGGDVCKHCIIDAVNSLDDRPRAA